MAIAAKRPDKTPDQIYTGLYARYIANKELIDSVTLEQKKVRQEIAAFVDEHGTEDGNGHKVLSLPDDIEGPYVAFQNQRRVSASLDEEAAERIAAYHKVTDRLFPLVPTFDQQETAVLLNEGVISEEELSEMFPSEVTFVTTPVRRSSK